MCLSCHPLRKYETIHSKTELESAKQHAITYVEQGSLQITKEMDSDNYNEIEFYCKECGTKHVLWLHTQFLEHGGEWRTIPTL